MLDIKQIACLALVAVVSYLLGSVSFAVLVSRVWAKEDVRMHGSGSAGMTNILRTYGVFPAFLTALGDFGKGVLAAALGRGLLAAVGIALFDGGYFGLLFALLGHMFPVFFGFKGGKGVLAGFGGMLVVNPAAFLFLFIVCVPVALLTRYVSVASLLGAAMLPFVAFRLDRMRGVPPYGNFALVALLAGLVIFMHRENIKRLIAGTERRINSVPKVGRKH